MLLCRALFIDDVNSAQLSDNPHSGLASYGLSLDNDAGLVSAFPYDTEVDIQAVSHSAAAASGFNGVY